VRSRVTVLQAGSTAHDEGYDSDVKLDDVIMPVTSITSPASLEQQRVAAARAIFAVPWSVTVAEERARSPHGTIPGWRLVSAIVKSNDDLRQEQFVAQLVRYLGRIAVDDGIPVWVSRYGACPSVLSCTVCFHPLYDCMCLFVLPKSVREGLFHSV
jgi:hypothetical protein